MENEAIYIQQIILHSLSITACESGRFVINPRRYIIFFELP